MKKRISLLLSAVMLSTLIMPAAAAQVSADKRLENVTTKVKQTLDLNTDAYTDFDGGLVENTLAPVWHLNWTGKGETLTITAGEDGRIISYYRWNEDERPEPGMRLPKGSLESARKSAQDFVNRVLAKGVETVTLEKTGGQSILGRTTYHFSSNIKLNEVSSPLSVRLEVRAADNTVIRFERDDRQSGYAGTLPSPKAQIGQDKASKSLNGLLSLRLEYVLSADGKTASLRYVPNSRPEYYLDAHSGALVNLTALLENLRKEELSSGAVGSAPESEQDSGLTGAEQSGVEKLAGVLGRDALDQKLRAMPELGLSGYTLSRVRFYTDEATKKDAQPKVHADLLYGKRETGGKTWHKSITADGRTGALQSLWSSIPHEEKASRPIGKAGAQTKAAAFLGTYYGGDSARYAHYAPDEPVMQEENPDQWQHTYARRENGYFLPVDHYAVGISARDGTISSFSIQRPTGEVVFDGADGVIDAATALGAWQGSFKTKLSYVAVPAALDLSNPDYRPLIALGQTWIHTLKLGWQLSADPLALGVDAKTGKLVRAEAPKTEDISYTDLDKSWAKTHVLRLAEYGVGYRGGVFGPNEAIRQKDMLALMLSMWGARYDPGQLTGDQADTLYQEAYWRGLLSRAERSDDKLLTRADVVKLILDGAGYGSAAKLEDIYTCRYTDAAAIPAAFYGYAALAQGLGLVQSRGAAFSGERTAIRAEAAVMMYNLLNR